jgi:hypothetical protein
MKKLTRLKGTVQNMFAVAVIMAGLMMSGLMPPLFAADTNTNAVAMATNSVPATANPPEAKKVKVKRRLTGAELYSINCNRCHQERYPTERTGAQWKTIMLHMQIRANIPVSQARLILKYLQDNSGR